MSSTLPPVILGTELVPLEKRPRKAWCPSRQQRSQTLHLSLTFSRKEIQPNSIKTLKVNSTMKKNTSAS